MRKFIVLGFYLISIISMQMCQDSHNAIVNSNTYDARKYTNHECVFYPDIDGGIYAIPLLLEIK